MWFATSRGSRTEFDGDVGRDGGREPLEATLALRCRSMIIDDVFAPSAIICPFIGLPKAGLDIVASSPCKHSLLHRKMEVSTADSAGTRGNQVEGVVTAQEASQMVHRVKNGLDLMELYRFSQP